MEEERYSLKRHSMGSRRSQSSDRSLQGLIEDLSGRVPRYNDIVYVMSIESENSKRSRASDLFERKGNSIRYSNEGRQMEVESSHDLSRGSHGILGKYQPKQTQQMYHQEVALAHQCDCYRDCTGQQCACAKTLLIEPCIQGKCCSGCIELKNRRIQLATQSAQVKIQPRPSAPIIISKSGCSCKKTRCLKLYCECFARKGFCNQNCNCQQCLNMVESQARNNAMIETPVNKQQQRGCNCRKTKCQKKYCACFGAGLKCTKLCQCQNCFNMNQQLKAIRNFQIPQQQPFYPPMAPVTPVDKLPVNIEFTDFQLPNFGNLRISDDRQ